MESAVNRNGTHLTEVEISLLLEAPNESQIVDRANRHLDECRSCQLLLEHYAAKPDDWKRFASVMEEHEKYRTSTPDNENIDEASYASRKLIIVPDGGRSALNVAVITALVVVLAIVLLFRFPEVIRYWRNGTQAEPTSAPDALTAPPPPSAPAGPTSAPIAPTTTYTPKLDSPH